MEIDVKRIEAAIVDEAVDKIVTDDQLYRQVQEGIEKRISKLWAERAESMLEAEVQRAFEAGLERTYQKVNTYGVPQGEPTSIRAEMEKLVGDYWSQRVDREGKPTSNSYNTSTRAEWLMAKLCAADFSGEMKQHVVNVGGALKDAFRRELHATVARLLSEVFHVKSLDDSGKGRECIDPTARPVGAP